MNFSSSIKNGFTFLGIYQIFGGAFGLLLIGWYFLQGRIVVTSGHLIILSFIIILFGYSIYCGILALQKKVFTIRLSLINQWLQLFGLVFFGYGIEYSAGPYLGISIDLSNSFDANVNIGLSSWATFIHAKEPSFLINFNFIPLGLIFFITKFQEKIGKEKMAQLMELGQEAPKSHFSS